MRKPLTEIIMLFATLMMVLASKIDHEAMIEFFFTFMAQWDKHTDGALTEAFREAFS